ncbi:MAG: hypothetical protein V1789_01330 [PVC group bacterium]
MKHGWLILTLIALIVLPACVTPHQRRQDYVDEHPGLSGDLAKAIMEGRIAEGMTADDVRASWGDPDRETLSITESGNQEIWSYDTPIGKFTGGTVILTFINRKLTNLVN